MSDLPEIFKKLETYTEEQQQIVGDWIQNNPSCSMQQLVAFVNSV
tara:strand:+ start:400 stop:534 length:135 start_codon:yes stop_codon:yes gene_type:complete